MHVCACVCMYVCSVLADMVVLISFMCTLPMCLFVPLTCPCVGGGGAQVTMLRASQGCLQNSGRFKRAHCFREAVPGPSNVFLR